MSARPPSIPDVTHSELLRGLALDQANLRLWDDDVRLLNEAADMIDNSPPKELPAFLRWCGDELRKRDTMAGSFAPSVAESLRGRAIIIEHVLSLRAKDGES